ncbi:protoporphyrinogen oxidase [Cephus cinctus]|uniref:Protoporphyrinogen oxidase n=1 Tax=Cephus cinctus TaxID=211228 RepID=A0AAJ7FEV8_CEPCN|nr:protoporphyrinogen oxidase [Cephus cinctus]
MNNLQVRCIKMTVILGGGISGLSAAYYALENPRISSMVLLEASNRVGGWICSNKSPNGAIFEQGPRTVRPRGPGGKNTLELIDRLKLTEKLIPIVSSHPAARNRLIYAENKLHLLPNNLKSLFVKNSPFDRPLISILMNDIKAPRISKEDESIYSFVERRLGKDVADNLISPMICGICAGDAKQISVNFLMPSLFEAEQKHGSIAKGLLMNRVNQMFATKTKVIEVSGSGTAEMARKNKWAIWGLKDGLEQLPRTLADNLKSRGLDIRLGNRCERLTFKPGYVELTINGETDKYSRIVSSIAAKNLAQLVRRQHPQLARELEAIPTVTVAVVNIQFSGNVLPMQAFGFLVPPKENLPILGVIFDSCVFPHETDTVLTVMMGGAWFEKNFGECPSKDEILRVAVESAKKILGIKESPVAHKVTILRDCIPQHVVGHKQRLNRIHNYISAHGLPLALCGSSYQGVGLNDVILSAKHAVSDIS